MLKDGKIVGRGVINPWQKHQGKLCQSSSWDGKSSTAIFTSILQSSIRLYPDSKECNTECNFISKAISDSVSTNGVCFGFIRNVLYIFSGHACNFQLRISALNRLALFLVGYPWWLSEHNSSVSSINFIVQVR
jgi:hypothetical protein